MATSLPPALALLSLTSTHAAPAQNPVELGRVSWGRDHDAALARAKRERKPVFCLFQEVPG